MASVSLFSLPPTKKDLSPPNIFNVITALRFSGSQFIILRGGGTVAYAKSIELRERGARGGEKSHEEISREKIFAPAVQRIFRAAAFFRGGEKQARKEDFRKFFLPPLSYLKRSGNLPSCNQQEKKKHMHN